MEIKTKDIRTKISTNTYIALKALAVSKGQRMDETIEEAMRSYIHQNKETLKRIAKELEGL